MTEDDVLRIRDEVRTSGWFKMLVADTIKDFSIDEKALGRELKEGIYCEMQVYLGTEAAEEALTRGTKKV
jgi:hypothetical protein